jgi:hypothetical protein
VSLGHHLWNSSNFIIAPWEARKLILETSFEVETTFKDLNATKWAVKECKCFGLTNLFQLVSPFAYESLV